MDPVAALVTKSEAERLIDALEAGEPRRLTKVLTSVLMRLTGLAPPSWDLLISTAALVGKWTDARTHAVRSQDPAALEQLTIDLSELRSLRVDG